jgi:hypothetical protein
MLISLDDVIRLAKERMGLLNNSIRINTVFRSYLFTSFVSRDDAYEMMDTALRNVEDEFVEEEFGNGVIAGADIPIPEMPS